MSKLNKVTPVPIELHGQDPETSSGTGAEAALHITNVMVGDYHLVKGDGGISFTVWTVKIILDNSEYTSILLYKRYSDVEHFQHELKNAFSQYNYSIPELPPKSSFSVERITMSSRWMEERRRGLQWFLSNVLLNPAFQRSSVVRKFILE